MPFSEVFEIVLNHLGPNIQCLDDVDDKEMFTIKNYSNHKLKWVRQGAKK